jgi:tetratricopeptide (TPR) repeat protein
MLPLPAAYMAGVEDPRDKFGRQAVESFQRALELYERASDEYTKDTSKPEDMRDKFLQSAHDGMEKSAYQAGNYYRNKANALDARAIPADPAAARQRVAEIRKYNGLAARYFERLLELRASGNDAEVGKLLVWLVGLYYDLEDKPAAEKYYGRALAAYAKARPGVSKAAVLSSIAATLNAAGQVKPAIIFLEQAQAEYKNEGDLLGQADTFYMHGGLLEGQAERGWSVLSNEKYEQALAAYRQIPDRLFAGSLDHLFYMGDFWEKSGEYKLALDAMRLAVTVSSRLRLENTFYADREAKANDEFASLLSLTGQTKQAIEAYERAHTLYKSALEQGRREETLTNLKRIRRTIEALKAALYQAPPADKAGASK